jgi:beta-galactosidase
MTFSRKSGRMISWQYQGKEILLQGPEPNFWRAPNDNDFGNGMQKRCRIWRDAGKRTRLVKIEAKQAAPHQVRLTVRYAIPAGDSIFQQTFTIWGSGDVVVGNHFKPGTLELPEIPRMGVNLVLHQTFARLSYLGRGPHENYCDRKTSAPVSLYHQTVSQQYHPYIRPQENGNKTDIRWLSLSDSSGTGFLVVGMPLLSVSAHHFLNQDFDEGVEKKNRHTFHVKPRPLVSLNLDLKQMGVGGDTSWGAKPHPPYQIPVKEYFFSFRCRPFDARKEFPSQLSKQIFPH